MNCRWVRPIGQKIKVKTIMSLLRRYFFSGLLVLLPILLTFLVISFIVDLLNHSLELLPAGYQPQAVLGYEIPGVGVLLSVLIVFFTGMISSNFIGRHIMSWGEKMLSQVPFVSPVYQATKQVLQTLFSSESRSFRHVCLVEYPRKGIWTVAFETGDPSSAIKSRSDSEDLISVFIPTTPNPTSGFLIFVSRADTKPLTISVDDALKLVISLGVVQPSDSKKILDKDKNYDA